MELGLSLGGVTFGIAKENSDPMFSHSGEGSPASSFEMSKKKSEEIGEGDCKKKLRLSKDQSAFLEESYKEHINLTPKQKGCLAKKLDLRPRQVEVWFQNRRARSKLKQTEVDCENLRRRCETLAEENTRLHQELQDLRALNSSDPLLCFQTPATTLTICPSCQFSCDTKTYDAAPSS